MSNIPRFWKKKVETTTDIFMKKKAFELGIIVHMGFSRQTGGDGISNSANT